LLYSLGDTYLKIYSSSRYGLLVSVLLVSMAAVAGDYDPETMTVKAASLLPAEMLK